MSWEAILAATGGALGAGASVYVALSYRSIERYKAELQRTGFEHQTRFARLHEKRVEVVAELYEKLVMTESALTAYVHPAQYPGDPPKEELGQQANAAVADFFRYFATHRIWLDASLVKDIESMLTEMRRAGITFSVFVGERPLERQNLEKWGEAWKTMSEEVPALRAYIEDRFREMLGGPAPTRQQPR